MKYKAIISDIDGTLTRHGPENMPTQKVIDAIRKAEEKGIIFTLATARPLFFLTHLFEHMQTNVLVIINNGAAIYDTAKKKTIWETTLDSQLMNKVLPFFRKTKRTKIHIDLTDGTLLSDPKEVASEAKAQKMVCIGTSEYEADKLINILEAEFKNIITAKAPSFIDSKLFDVYVTKPDATKQHAVLKLSEILNISPKEMIGIGDHYNDFPLLMACGLKVAMGNAVDDLKAIADYIAPSVEEDGIADVIEKFILST